MPELPEVETVRRGLTRLVGNAKITSVDVYYEKMVSPEAGRSVQWSHQRLINLKKCSLAKRLNGSTGEENICYSDSMMI